MYIFSFKNHLTLHLHHLFLILHFLPFRVIQHHFHHKIVLFSHHHLHHLHQLLYLQFRQLLLFLFHRHVQINLQIIMVLVHYLIPNKFILIINYPIYFHLMKSFQQYYLPHHVVIIIYFLMNFIKIFFLIIIKHLVLLLIMLHNNNSFVFINVQKLF